MLTRMKVANFRSIESCEVPLGPITILFGPTAGGKSSLLYSLLVFRNFIMNPNQGVDGLFNLGFQNLGGHDACVFNHDTTREVVIGLDYTYRRASGEYEVRLEKSAAHIRLATNGFDTKASVAIPYGVNQSFPGVLERNGEEFGVTWNGITSAVTPKTPTAETQATAQVLAASLNASVEALRRIDVVPHRRGFFKPSYTAVPLTPLPTSEDEVATIVINDMNLAPRISACAEEIFGRDFRFHIAPGTAIAYFQTTDKKTRTPGLLVNDGFGVNQVIYMLAKIQRLDVDTVLIEEPEVHLHPTIIRQLAKVLCSLVREEEKQLIFTTHSDQFLFAVLTCVKERLISASDVRCYHVTREARKSTFEPQLVHENGQIEGGLSSFVEAEVEDMRKFLSLNP